jgi:hypothetical protein
MVMETSTRAFRIEFLKAVCTDSNGFPKLLEILL